MSDKINIVLTGGHAATTAISCIEEIKSRKLDWNLFWIGPKSAVEGRLVPTLASKIMPKLDVKFIPIITGRLQRRFTIWTIPSLLKIPIGVFQSFKILIDIKPKAIMSFGGFASVPVCFAAWILRIPVLIHEQTAAAGLANRINSFFAKRILIARKGSEEYFPKDKIILTGNPVSKNILKIRRKNVLSLRDKNKNPVIYVTGGSSGAQRINKIVGESLYELLKNYKLIHQTGKLDYEEFKNKRDEFPSDLKKNYEVYDFIDPNEVYRMFETADIIISRSGANTVSEILVSGRPSILIPIPWTSHNEQFKNAKMIEKTGLGFILEEKDLNTQNLLIKLEYIVKNYTKIVKNADYSIADLDKEASKRIVEEIQALL